jgi:hypothetical protein
MYTTIKTKKKKRFTRLSRMKDIKLIILFTVLVCFSGKAQSFHQFDSISKILNLRINVQGALVANNGFSNLSFKFLHPETAGNLPQYNDYGYTKNNSKSVCFGFNAGIEFILGRKPHVKHLLSLTYDLTNSLYNDYRIIPWGIYHNVDGYIFHENISRKVQFVSLNYGPLFNITKKLKLATIASVNFCALQTDIMNGYYVDYHPAFYYSSASSDSTKYNNSKTTSTGIAVMVSLKLRASYDVTKYLSIFAQRNFGITYKSPWWMLGLQFYPFKNFR